MTGIPEPPLVPRYIPVGSAAPSVVVAKPKKKPRSKPAEIFEIYNTEIQRLDEIPLLPTQPPISLTENSDHEPLTYPQSLRPAVLADESEQEGYDTHKLTCAINLICYRSRSGGCEMRQVQVAKRDRFEDEESFQKMLNNNPQLVQTDQQFFSRLQRIYLRDMCGFWRQNLTLKSLSSIGLLEYTPTTHARTVPLPHITHQEILYAYNNPSKMGVGDLWIDWIFQLRQENRRHALDFIEGWNAYKIYVAGILPLAASTLMGIVWSMKTGDVQTAFTVAGFVLTAGTVILALLAIISGIDVSGRTNA